jgi:hypothetical protein
MSLILVCSFASATHPASRQNPSPSVGQCAEIKQALDDSLQIKPGMARREVERQFKEEGGAQTRQQTRYIYKKCIYIQIEISFNLAVPRDSFDFSPNDTVSKVSKAYLAYPTVD